MRLVKTAPRNPPPQYTQSAGSWSTGGVGGGKPHVHLSGVQSDPLLFMASDPKVGGFTVEISTDKGIKGYGRGGPAGGYIVEGHLTKLLMNEDPFNVERIWDIMWRSTMHYGRAGAVINAISGADLAVWDIIGKATGMPVYKLLGGPTKPRIPSYCTGNDIEQHVEAGFKRLKLAIPHGLCRRHRRHAQERRAGEAGASGLWDLDGDIMLDCWMAWTERYISSRLPRCLRRTGCTGWRSACSRTTMRASDA